MSAFRRLRDGFVGRSLAGTSIRLIDVPSRYGFHLIVAVGLGVVEAGSFYIVFSAMMLLAGLGRLGIDRSLTRVVARALAQDRPGAARAAIGRAFRIAGAMSAVTIVAMAAGAGPVAVHLLKKPDLAWPLAVSSVTILPLTIGIVAAGALSGLNRILLSQMIYTWLWPAIFCVPALFLPIDLLSAILLVAASVTVSAAIGIVLTLRHLPPAAPGEPPAEPETLVATGLSLFTSEMIQLLLSYAPAFVLGILSTDAAVGRYALAWRMALGVNLLVATIGFFAAPRFAAFYARGDMDGLRKMAAQSIAMSAALSVVPTLIALVVAVPLLDLFGPGYAEAATTLRILLIGQMFAIAATATTELLGMTGFAHTLRHVNLLSLLVLGVGLAALSPPFGSEGAAMATALTIAVNGIATTVGVRRNLGFWPQAALVDQVAAFIRRRAQSAAPANPS
ncbi:MAG: oligosaccharide flippase family protein [Sphingomonas fennica]